MVYNRDKCTRTARTFGGLKCLTPTLTLTTRHEVAAVFFSVWRAKRPEASTDFVLVKTLSHGLDYLIVENIDFVAGLLA